MEVRGAAAPARPWRSVIRVAVVADPLDSRLEPTGGARARAATALHPAKVAGQIAGRLVPVTLRCAGRGHEVDGGAVAVRVVPGFAGSRDAQVVAPEHPEDVVVDPGVDRLRWPTAGHHPRR